MNPLPADDSPAPLRVLHLSGRSDHGGGPEHILQLISADLPGVIHAVACPDGGIYWARYAAVVGTDRLCHLPHRSLSFRAFRRLQNFARGQGIHVIHSHGTCAGIYGRMLALSLCLPVVHTFHGVPVTHSLKHIVHDLSERLLSQFTTCGVAVSQGEAELVRARWPHYRDKLATVPNGLDANSTSQPWSEWPPRDTLRIVTFTRCNKQKHPELLIEIARILHLTGVDFRIDAYGEGLPNPKFISEIQRRGLEGRLIFQPSTDTPAAALAKAHLYLSTSRWEGMPLAVIEAWRAGLLVVATDVIGNRDLVLDGQTGFLYPCSNGRIAGRLIKKLLTRSEPVDAVRQRAAYEAQTQYGRTRMVRRLVKLYRRMLDSAPTEKFDLLATNVVAEADNWTPGFGTRVITDSP